MQQEKFKEEKELFKSIAKEQSKELKEKLEKIIEITKHNKDSMKEKIVTGSIGMIDWANKWIPIHEKNEKITQSIQQHQHILSDKQQQFNKLLQEINQIQQELTTMEDQKHTLDFFDRFLQPIAEAEKELTSGFADKLNSGKYEEITMDEVSLFLNVCGMEDLVQHQREKKIAGEVLGDAIGDVAVMGIKDKLTERKMEFFLKVLESGKMLKDEELSKSAIWRHRDPEKTHLLLKKWEIKLDEELIKKKHISICQLLFFKAKDLQKVLGFGEKEAREISRKLRKMKKQFEDELAA